MSSFSWMTVLLGHGVHVRADAGALGTLVLAVLPPGDPAGVVGRLTFIRDDALAQPVTLRAGLHRWLTWSGGARGIADCTRWATTVRVGPHLLHDAAVMRHQVIEPAALFRVTACDRVPIHAAAIARGDRAVLLAGASGMGKSTLAWMATRAGYALLAEDVVYVARRPSLRLYGRVRRVHLRPTVAERVGAGEIGGRVVRGPGVAKVAVPVAPAARDAEAAGIIVLARGPAGPAVPLAPDQAARRLGAALPPGFTRFAAETGALAPVLAARGAWELAVDAQPERAFGALASLLEHLLPE